MRGRRAEEASKNPVEVRLIKKPARSGDLSQRQCLIALSHQFTRIAQPHPQQVLMRRRTGDMPKGLLKMTAAQLRQSGKLGYGKIIRKIGFQALNGATDAWRHRGSTRLSEVLIAYRAKYGHCQRLGQWFEVKPSVRALAFGFSIKSRHNASSC